jgi:hypothetical protein
MADGETTEWFRWNDKQLCSKYHLNNMRCTSKIIFHFIILCAFSEILAHPTLEAGIPQLAKVAKVVHSSPAAAVEKVEELKPSLPSIPSIPHERSASEAVAPPPPPSSGHRDVFQVVLDALQETGKHIESHGGPAP